MTPKLTKGDKITIEKMVDGVSVGFYEDPDNPGEPQIFIVGDKANSSIELKRDYDSMDNR